MRKGGCGSEAEWRDVTVRRLTFGYFSLQAWVELPVQNIMLEHDFGAIDFVFSELVVVLQTVVPFWVMSKSRKIGNKSGFCLFLARTFN